MVPAFLYRFGVVYRADCTIHDVPAQAPNNLNGLGRLFVDSVTNQDFAMTQYLVMLVVAIFVFTNFVVDVMYAWLDPRIRYS